MSNNKLFTLITLLLQLYFGVQSQAQVAHVFNFNAGYNFYTTGDIAVTSLKPTYELHLGKRFFVGASFDLSFGSNNIGLTLDDTTRKYTVNFNSKRDAENYWQTLYSSGPQKKGIKILSEDHTFLGTKTYGLFGGMKVLNKRKNTLSLQTGVNLSWINKNLIVSTEAGEFYSLYTGQTTEAQLVIYYSEKYIDLGQSFGLTYRHHLSERFSIGANISVDYYYITSDWNRGLYLSFCTKL